MIGWIYYAIVPAIFNIILASFKRKKTINECIKNLEARGYKVDRRLKRKIPKIIIEKSLHKRYEESKYYDDIINPLDTIPIIRMVRLFYSIKFLTTRSCPKNEEYAKIIEACLDYETVIQLEKEGIIKVDEELRQWITDRDKALKKLEISGNSLKELMEKYDNMHTEDSSKEKDNMNKEDCFKNEYDNIYSGDSIEKLKDKYDIIDLENTIEELKERLIKLPIDFNIRSDYHKLVMKIDEIEDIINDKKSRLTGKVYNDHYFPELHIQEACDMVSGWNIRKKKNKDKSKEEKLSIKMSRLQELNMSEGENKEYKYLP